MDYLEFKNKANNLFTSNKVLGETLFQYIYDEDFEKELYTYAARELYTYMNSYTEEYDFAIILGALTFIAIKYYNGAYWEHVYKYLKKDMFRMSEQVFSSKVRECIRENCNNKVNSSRLIDFPVMNAIIPFNYMDDFFTFCFDIYFYNFRCSLKDFRRDDLVFIYDSLRSKMSESANEFTVKGLNKTYVLLKSTQNMIISGFGIESLINVTENVIRMIDNFYWDKPIANTYEYYNMPFQKWIKTVNSEEKKRKTNEARERTDFIKWIPKFTLRNNEVYLETREDNISDVYEKRLLEMLIYEDDKIIHRENNLEVENIIGGYRIASKRFIIKNPFNKIKYVLKCKDQIIFESEEKLYRNDVLMFTISGNEIKNNTNHNDEEIVFITKEKIDNYHALLKNGFYITRIVVDSTMQFKIGNTVIGFNEIPHEGINGVECSFVYFDFNENNKIYSKIHNIVFNYNGDISSAYFEINNIKQKVTDMDCVEIKKINSLYSITLKGAYFENNYYKIKLGELGNKKYIKEYYFILDEDFSFETEHSHDNFYLFYINSSLYETEPQEWELQNKWEFALECPIEDEETYHTIIFKLKSPIFRLNNKQWYSFSEGICKDEMMNFDSLQISGVAINKLQLYNNKNVLLLDDIPFKQVTGVYQILTSTFISYSSYKFVYLKVIDCNLKEYNLTIANELLFSHLDLSLDESSKTLTVTPFYLGKDEVEIKLKYGKTEKNFKCHSGESVCFDDIARCVIYKVTVEYMNFNSFSFEELFYRPFVWIGQPIPSKTIFDIKECDICRLKNGIEEFIQKNIKNMKLVVNKLLDENDNLYSVSLLKEKDGRLVYLSKLKEVKMNVISKPGINGKIKCVITDQDDFLLYDPNNDTIFDGEHPKYLPIEDFTLTFKKGAKHD